jgi:hypothetical protein
LRSNGVRFMVLLRLKIKEYMLFGAKMVLCALAGLSASLHSVANLPAAAHKTIMLRQFLVIRRVHC